MAQNDNFNLDQLIEKVRENYLSIALGLLVLLVAVSIIIRANDTGQEAADDAEKTAQEEMEGTQHIVQAGESVSSIARDQLGSMDYTQAIVDANNLENPEVIEVGQTLILPEVGNNAMEGEADEESVEEAMEGGEMMEGDLNGDGVTTTAPGGAITGDTYTVQEGDTLFEITVRAYNDSSMMRAVMRANNIWNPNYIESGTTLTLPR